MDKQKILDALNFNRSSKLQPSNNKEIVTPEDTIQIAKKSSKCFYENLTLFRGEDKCYVVVHDKKYPSSQEIKQEHNRKGYWYITCITPHDYEIIKESIQITNSYLDYYINPHTSLVMLCISKGLNLIDKGIIDL